MKSVVVVKEENKDKLLQGIPYFDAENGEIDYCLGKTENEVKASLATVIEFALKKERN